MFATAASAAASFAATSLVAIVSGAGSWHNKAFGKPPSAVDWQGHAVGLDGDGRRTCPGFFRRLMKPQNRHCHSP